VLKNSVNSEPRQQQSPPSLVDETLEFTPPNYKRLGEDWFAIFNKHIPSSLDVNLLHTFEHDNIVTCLRFSPDGRYIATRCRRTAQIFDLGLGQKVATFNHAPAEFEGESYMLAVCFYPDGRYLATGGEGNFIRIWNLAQMRIKTMFAGHKEDVYCLDFTRDGRRLASGSKDRTARVWDSQTGQCLLTLWISVSSVAFSSDSKFLAIGSLDCTVHI